MKESRKMLKLLHSTRIPKELKNKPTYITVQMNGRILDKSEYSVSETKTVTVNAVRSGTLTITYSGSFVDKFKKLLGSNYYKESKKGTQ